MNDNRESLPHSSRPRLRQHISYWLFILSLPLVAASYFWTVEYSVRGRDSYEYREGIGVSLSAGAVRFTHHVFELNPAPATMYNVRVLLADGFHCRPLAARWWYGMSLWHSLGMGAEWQTGPWSDPDGYGMRGSLHAISLPLWFVPLLTAWPALRFSRARRRERLARRRQSRGLCLACGYDVRASVGRCPECGLDIPAPAAELVRRAA